LLRGPQGRGTDCETRREITSNSSAGEKRHHETGRYLGTDLLTSSRTRTGTATTGASFLHARCNPQLAQRRTNCCPRRSPSKITLLISWLECQTEMEAHRQLGRHGCELDRNCGGDCFVRRSRELATLTVLRGRLLGAGATAPSLALQDRHCAGRHRHSRGPVPLPLSR
jgi:hypothetical protein